MLELYGLRQGCSSCRLPVGRSPEVTNRYKSKLFRENF